MAVPAAFGGAYRRELHAAIDAVRKAARLSSAIQSRLGRDEQVSKVDESPVTIADFGVQAVCTLLLKKAFPDYGWVAEEDSAFLRKPEGASNLRKIAEAVNAATEGSYSEAEVLDALDVGLGPGGATGRHWVLDPVDGTKGFIRGDQYAIALGLLDAGKVVLGILGCPNLPWNLEEPSAPRGCLLYGVRGEGSYQVSFDGARGPVKCAVSKVSDTAWARVAESYESAHSSHDTTGAIGATLGTSIAPLRMDSQAKYAARLEIARPPIRMDSQAKYGVLARGEADVYLRFPKKGYKENIWDHCGGALIIEEAGGSVTDEEGKPLDFSQGRKLSTVGIMASNGQLHPLVVAAVRHVLAGQP
eukprot:tig00000802_g4277.t1